MKIVALLKSAHLRKKLSLTEDQRFFLDFFFDNEILCLFDTGEIRPIPSKREFAQMSQDNPLILYEVHITGETSKKDIVVSLSIDNKVEKDDSIIFRDKKIFLVSMYRQR